jgi:hypothetical protein
VTPQLPLIENGPEVRPQPPEQRRKRIASEALRARVTLGLAGLALLASAITLAAKFASARTVGVILGFLAVLVILAQLLARSYLMQLEQEAIVETTAASAEGLQKELRAIRRTTEEELRIEEKQNKHLEQLFTAMKELKLIQVESLDVLSQSRPATLFYLLRHRDAIVDVLSGYWDRTESLLPSQLWGEYKNLVGGLRQDQIFRSTVCVPSEPSRLFDNSVFTNYVAAIYEAAETKSVQVRRLVVLDGEEWPPDEGSLDSKLYRHLRELHDKEDKIPTLTARVTSDEIARAHFKLNPDFMVWGDELLVKSDIPKRGDLVTHAEFYFPTNSQAEEIRRRQEQFDTLFDDATRALPLAAVIHSS